MIEAKGLVYAVGARRLLDQVDAAFEPGRLHLIVGPNGAGKSTLIKVLARLLRPARGRIDYDGRDVSGDSAHDLATRRAVLSQAVEVAFPLSVREVVMLGRHPHFGSRPAPVDEIVCAEVMDYFDVHELGARLYPTLSGGEKQRVNFARVLGQVWRPVPGRCRCLFLDEPLTFLDIRHQIDFMKKIRRFSAQADVVTVGVVHDLALAARFADTLLLMQAGRVVASGRPRNVLTRERIVATFEVEPLFFGGPGGSTLHVSFE